MSVVTPPRTATPRFTDMIGIVALPRSGTTVVTAVLDVHSRVFGVYEPWNANRDTMDAHAPMPYGDFVGRFARGADAGADVLLVKETATIPAYVDRIGDLLRAAQVERRSLLLILRTPLHVFLSEVQARQEWWGAPELRVNVESFSNWASRTLDALKRLATLAREQDALILSYDRFAGSLRGVNALTEALGLVPEPAQLVFEKHLDRSKVRGDNNVGKAPRPVSSASVQRRASEFQAIRGSIEGARDYPRIEALGTLFAALPLISRAREQAALIDELIG